MSSTLPTELQQAAERYLTSEFVTIDAYGRPIVWPVTPYFRAGEGCIDVTTGVGYPKKADDAARNPHVALLFSDPTGSVATSRSRHPAASTIWMWRPSSSSRSPRP